MLDNPYENIFRPWGERFLIILICSQTISFGYFVFLKYQFQTLIFYFVVFV